MLRQTTKKSFTNYRHLINISGIDISQIVMSLTSSRVGTLLKAKAFAESNNLVMQNSPIIMVFSLIKTNPTLLLRERERLSHTN